MFTPTQGVWQPAGCVSCELVCVCVSFVRVVIICPASTHTALVKKERKKTDKPREGWEDGTPPPHRDFKERGVVR